MYSQTSCLCCKTVRVPSAYLIVCLQSSMSRSGMECSDMPTNEMHKMGFRVTALTVLIAMSTFGSLLGSRDDGPVAAEVYAGPLKLTALSAGSSVAMVKGSYAPTVYLSYSVDEGRTWSDFVPGSTTVVLTSAGDSVLITATSGKTNYQMSSGDRSTYSNYFSLGGSIDASGDPRSLLRQDMSVSLSYDSVFCALFYNCSALRSARLVLPSDEVPKHGYSYMFYGCKSLEHGPCSLPAQRLYIYSYQYMFYGCTSLVRAPDILASHIPGSTCQYMFYNCSSLVDAPSIEATTMEGDSFSHMFHGCASLRSAPRLRSLSMIDRGYQYMFYGCSSLVDAPDLPATSLRSSCYASIFSGCTSLSKIRLLYTGTISSTYFSNWVKDVPSGGVIYYKGATTATGASAVPAGWTVLKNW